MPIEPIVEVAVQIAAEGAVQIAGEATADKVHRRFGWKGCISSLLAIAAIITLFVYLH